ncbi:MAG: hypothetical protein VX275_01215 [Pseudomonadota bacterium]|nr:hypothetical protein [Pseudomonadota bacterium]
MFIMIAMLLLVRRLLVFVFLAVAIESAAQGELRMANDLHGLGRESNLRKIPVVLFFSSVHCEYCDLVRDEFLNYLSTDPAFMNKLLLREVRMDSIRPLLDFSRQSISHAAFTEQRAIELVPTIQFTDGVGDILVEDIVGVTTLGFYGAYLEQAIEQSLNILRLRN